MSSDLGSAASYSFAAGSSGIPPAFSSRRTSASVLSSSANSVHQSAVMAAGPSAAAASGGGGGSYRNSNPSSAFAAAATRSVSTTSTVGGGGGGIGGRFASFTSTTTPIDEGNTSYTSSIHPTSTSASSTIRPGPDIIERPRDKIRQAEVSLSSLSFLFSEIVSYTQNRVTGVTDLEKRLSLIGYTVGQRILALTMHRQEMANNPKNPKRETKLLPTLLWIHTSFWKAAFGKPADSLERSTEAGRGDEYMISTNVPTFSKSICVPNDMSQLSVEAITAGMVEAALDGLGFPARVTAHTVATPQFPNRTTILIKLDKSVMDREDALASS